MSPRRGPARRIRATRVLSAGIGRNRTRYARRACKARFGAETGRRLRIARARRVNRRDQWEPPRPEPPREPSRPERWLGGDGADRWLCDRWAGRRRPTGPGRVHRAPHPRSGPVGGATTRAVRATPRRASRGSGREGAPATGTAPSAGRRTARSSSGTSTRRAACSGHRPGESTRRAPSPASSPPPRRTLPATQVRSHISRTGSAGWSCAPASTASPATSRSTPAACS